MPKLAVVSLIQDDQPLNAMVDFAIEHGFQVVELMGKFHSAETLSEHDLRYLEEESESHGITFNQHYLHGAMPGSHRTMFGTTRLRVSNAIWRWFTDWVAA